MASGSVSVHCALYGHEWSGWQAASDLPIKARECQRCHRRDAVWLSGTRPQWQTGVPRLEILDRPTWLMRVWRVVLTIAAAVWAALCWAGRRLVGLAAWVRASAPGWLSAAQGACKHLWAAARTVGDSLTHHDRGEP